MSRSVEAMRPEFSTSQLEKVFQIRVGKEGYLSPMTGQKR